jgi:hypothetical protein
MKGSRRGLEIIRVVRTVRARRSSGRPARTPPRFAECMKWNPPKSSDLQPEDGARTSPFVASTSRQAKEDAADRPSLLPSQFPSGLLRTHRIARHSPSTNGAPGTLGERGAISGLVLCEGQEVVGPGPDRERGPVVPRLDRVGDRGRHDPRPPFRAPERAAPRTPPPRPPPAPRADPRAEHGKPELRTRRDESGRRQADPARDMGKDRARIERRRVERQRHHMLRLGRARRNWPAMPPPMLSATRMIRSCPRPAIQSTAASRSGHSVRPKA